MDERPERSCKVPPGKGNDVRPGTGHGHEERRSENDESDARYIPKAAVAGGSRRGEEHVRKDGDGRAYGSRKTGGCSGPEADGGVFECAECAEGRGDEGGGDSRSGYCVPR